MGMTPSTDPVRLRKDGNSLVVTVARDLLEELEWDQGDLVIETVDEDRLIIEPAEIRRVDS